jgi:DNA ligase-associated metallophosphoesterase
LTIEQAHRPRGIDFALAGERLTADASGALYWPREKMLIVADLHFEKGSSFARRGVFLPPYDTRATLAALAEATARFNPSTIVALGDSFHDARGPERLSSEEHAQLAALMQGRDWLWLLGNHDPALPEALGGAIEDEIRIGPLTLRHEPRPGSSPGEIAGHLHPCATVRSQGRRFRRRCFAYDGSRLVLPAFGAYTGGLCVLDAAFALVLQSPFKAMLLGRERVYPIRHTRLVPDAA